LKRSAYGRGLMQAKATVDPHMKGRGIGRIALLIAIGAMLAGCDKCGNFAPLGSATQIEVCREQPPKPQ
jgi:hypothetical protein